jgi:hypothetical protein
MSDTSGSGNGAAAAIRRNNGNINRGINRNRFGFFRHNTGTCHQNGQTNERKQTFWHNKSPNGVKLYHSQKDRSF